MKKSLLILSALFATMAMNAQSTSNYFPASEVDADGWLWFNNQTIIDKYVGYENTAILLASATFEPYDEPYASATVKGVGTDGVLASEGCKTGAIVLNAASGIMKETGGGFYMHLPSCAEVSLCFSSDAKMYPSLKGGPGALETIDCGLVRGFTVFKPLASAGVFTWSGMADLVHGTTGLTIKSESPVTVYIQNANSHDLYVHGIYLKVYGEGGGVEGVESDNNAITFAGNVASTADASTFTVYNFAGAEVVTASGSQIDLGNLSRGGYIVRAANASGVWVKKVIVK